MDKVDKETPEERGYRRQRERAREEKIMASMNRKLGYFVPIDVDNLPRKTQSQYDPRRR